MASGVDVLHQSVVAHYQPNVVKVTIREGESVEAALARAGFSLVAPDMAIEWPVDNIFTAGPDIGADINARIKGMIDSATLAPIRPASNGFCWLDRIKF